MAHACAQALNHVQLFATLWTQQAPLSVGFSRQEYWRGLSFPPPGDLPDLGMEPTPVSCALAGGFSTTESPERPHRVARSLLKIRLHVSYRIQKVASILEVFKVFPFNKTNDNWIYCLDNHTSVLFKKSLAWLNNVKLILETWLGIIYAGYLKYRKHFIKATVLLLPLKLGGLLEHWVKKCNAIRQM